jgi:spermidine synthase
MHLHVEDGRDFIEATGVRHDLIILDCFGTDSIPAHLSTVEFLNAVRTILSPDGTVVANVWGRAANPHYAHMLLTYRAAFEDVYVFDVPAPGTKLFVGLQRQQTMTREELSALAQEISQARGFTYALQDAIAGFRNARFESISRAHVLRD